MNRRSIAFAGLLLAFALAASASGCGKNGDNANNGGNSVPSTPAGSPAGTGTNDTLDVMEIYKANCLACHGAELGGGVGPNLTKVGGELTADQIHAKIENGGGGMPAFKEKLTADEINALAAWLSAKK